MFTSRNIPLSLVLLTMLCCIQPTTLKMICVKPTADSHCDCNAFTECNVLMHFVENMQSSFASNVFMELMPGTHNLDSSIKRNEIYNFTMAGQPGSFVVTLEGKPEPTARIKCNGPSRSGFHFISSSMISIERMSIEGCGIILVNKSGTLVTAALALDNVTDVTIDAVKIFNSRGFGLHASRAFGNVLVNNSVFDNNTGGNDYYGGNVNFWYGNCFHYTYPNTSVVIKSSWFTNGRDDTKTSNNLFYPNATGLSVHVGCHRITVNITNITAVHNQGHDGGNVATSLNFTQGAHSAVYFSDSVVAHGISYRGGGLKVWSLTPNITTAYPNDATELNPSLLLSNITFYNNTAESSGGALYLSHYETRCSNCSIRNIRFEHCMFTANKVPAHGNGPAMQILQHRLPAFAEFANKFDVIFSDCLFSNNTIILDQRNIARGSNIELISSYKTTFHNCNFTGNNVTALSARNSNLFFSGNIIFDSNKGTNGGALKFCDTSIMYLENQTFIQFVNNSASNAGGAIYAQQRCLESAPPCFFQPMVEDYTDLSSINNSMSIEFHDNSANVAGDVVYGGAVDYCFTYELLVFNSDASYYHNYHIFNTMFQYNYSDQKGFSRVSSDPYGVCFCNSDHFDCKNNSITIGPTYPGELFTIFAITVGQREGFSPAPIDAIIMENENDESSIILKDLPEPVNQYSNCVALKYYIHTAKREVIVNLTAQQPSPDAGSFYYGFKPPQIKVKFRKCSWGFMLSSDSKYCMCHHNLLPYIHPNNNVRCYINSHTIRRQGSMWIGYDYKTFTSTKLFVDSCDVINPTDACQYVTVSLRCPYDYCVVTTTNISMTSTEKQCSFNRTGTLCGACNEGLTVSFGGSHCLTCNWYHLLILVPIAFLGVLLVVVLSCLNLTVTEGTINGLIFYANIIEVNRAIYYPGKQSHVLLQTFAAVISWLNLDLGIKTCLYPGMDTYAKVWYQFAFPVYIWLIAAIIILLSRRYPFFNKLSGRNAVKVLATLFLLSMAKLGRTVIAVFAMITVKLPDGVIDHVWLSDGNVGFLRGKHIPLFVAALCFSALLLVFTTVLTLVQCLQKSNWHGFIWVHKLKPLFDAYAGPYKDRFRFWTGFLLIVRATLFVFYAASDALNNQEKLVATTIASCVICILAWIFGGVYKNKLVDVLEASFVLNVAAISIAMCYIEGLEVNKQVHYSHVAFGISSGLALLTFLGVIAYHIFKFTRIYCVFLACCNSMRRHCLRRQSRSEAAESDESKPLITHTEIPTPVDHSEGQHCLSPDQRYPVARFDQLREPVMDLLSA